jgi:hypothetical protein
LAQSLYDGVIDLISWQGYHNKSICTSETQPISDWQVGNGLCSAFSNWKTKKLRRLRIPLRSGKAGKIVVAQFTNAQSFHQWFYK